MAVSHQVDEYCTTPETASRTRFVLSRYVSRSPEVEYKWFVLPQHRESIYDATVNEEAARHVSYLANLSHLWQGAGRIGFICVHL